MKNILSMAALVVALCATSGLALAAEAAQGEAVFQQCAACHGEAGVGTESGPALAGLFGRKAGSAEGFRYSPAMKRSGIVWDAASLKQFVADPQALVRGNRMPFDGIKDMKELEDLAAYVAGLK